MTGDPVYPCHGYARALFAAVLLVSAVAHAQSPSAQNPSPPQPQDSSAPQSAEPSAVAPTPSFDVASIHANKSDRTNRSHIYYSLENSQFRTVNTTVMDLVEWAWDLPGSRILSAPAWLRSTRFDIDAESDSAADDKFRLMIPEAAKSLKRGMVQALLADRFHLATRLETRNLPTYALVVHKKGPKFSPVPDGPRKVDSSSHSGTATVTITSSSTAMGDLAEILAPYVGRVVIDKTNITGIYSISLKFSSEYGFSNSNTPPSDAPPGVFMALIEQLGLELKPEKGTVEVLAIDHVEPPSEN